MVDMDVQVDLMSSNEFRAKKDCLMAISTSVETQDQKLLTISRKHENCDHTTILLAKHFSSRRNGKISCNGTEVYLVPGVGVAVPLMVACENIEEAKVVVTKGENDEWSSESMMAREVVSLSHMTKRWLISSLSESQLPPELIKHEKAVLNFMNNEADICSTLTALKVQMNKKEVGQLLKENFNFEDPHRIFEYF